MQNFFLLSAERLLVLASLLGEVELKTDEENFISALTVEVCDFVEDPRLLDYPKEEIELAVFLVCYTLMDLLKKLDKSLSEKIRENLLTSLKSPKDLKSFFKKINSFKILTSAQRDLVELSYTCLILDPDLASLFGKREINLCIDELRLKQVTNSLKEISLMEELPLKTVTTKEFSFNHLFQSKSGKKIFLSSLAILGVFWVILAWSLFFQFQKIF